MLSDELMLGNNLYFDSIIVSVTPEDFIVMKRTDKSYTPVILNGNVLNASGFIYNVLAGMWKHDHTDFTLIEGRDGEFFHPALPDDIKIRTLHHLQNVHFVHTGEKLHLNRSKISNLS